MNADRVPSHRFTGPGVEEIWPSDCWSDQLVSVARITEEDHRLGIRMSQRRAALKFRVAKRVLTLTGASARDRTISLRKGPTPPAHRLV